ncbi:MAG: DoxX family membrane protein [Bacteroidales bacterium]
MKEFWLWDAPAKEEQRAIANLFLRVFVGFVMLTHGFLKLTNFATLSTQFFDPLGIGTEASLILSIFAEVVCSFLLILGLLTRPAALVLVINMSVAAFLVHSEHLFAQKELALMYLAIYIVVTVVGGGKYSLDWVLFTSKVNKLQKSCQNMSAFDRIIRMYVALVLWYFVLAGIAHGVGAIILLIFSIPLLVTSFWGYCGMYNMLGKKSCKR